MIRTNSAWYKKHEVKVGDYGESLVRAFLESKGCICYPPVTDGSHLCDFFVYKRGYKMIAAEVKTKPMRNKYPDTGFDSRHYDIYKHYMTEQNMKMFLFFVDEKLKWIYGNYLDVLDKPFKAFGRWYPREECMRGLFIRYYAIDSMKLIRPLTDDELSKFKELRGSDPH